MGLNFFDQFILKLISLVSDSSLEENILLRVPDFYFEFRVWGTCVLVD